jgi:superfamily II DNA or RNA helicase
VSTTPAPPPSWPYLLDVFHQSSLQRGLDYARTGHVSRARLSERGGAYVLEAEVQGSAPQPYSVAVTLGRGTPIQYDIAGQCSCPVGYNCKHAAAALIAFFKLKPEPAPATGTGPRRATPAAPAGLDRIVAQLPKHLRDLMGIGQVPMERNHGPVATARARDEHRGRLHFELAPDRLPPIHERWLGQLRALDAPAQTTAPAPPPTHKLVVELDVPERATRLAVQLKYSVLRKDGSLGTLINANGDWWTLLRNPPRYVSEDDLPLLRRLSAATEDSNATRLLVADAALLRDLIAAGKAVTRSFVDRVAPWPGGSGQPGYTRHAAASEPIVLRAGAPRPAQATWIADDRGSQRFRLNVQPAAQVFVLEGLWYLDVVGGECGPIEPDVDARAAQILLQAPPISASEAPLVVRALDGMPLQAPESARPLPKPATMQLRRISAPGVVHLHLSNAPEGVSAAVQVHYGEIAVALDDRGTQRLVDGELLAPTLDLKLHEKTLNRLTSAGFEPDWVRAREFEADQTHSHSHFHLHESLVPQVMLEAVPRWRKQGWVVTHDAEFAWQFFTSGPIQIDSDAAPENGWFSVNLGVEIEGTRVDLVPVLARMLGDRHLRHWLDGGAKHPKATVNVRIDERRLVTLPIERVRTILHTLVELHQVDPDKPAPLRMARSDVLRLHDLAGADVVWNAPEPLRRLAEKLATFTAIEEAPVPTALNAELRPYQRAALSWLQFLREHELAGILADDMGLGKTVQAIAHVLTEKSAGRLTAPALVIAPTSVVHNWHAELERFAPGLRTLVLHGPARGAHFEAIAEHDVVLSTYPLLPRDIESLVPHEFHLAIFDEAQNLKNARSRAVEAAARLRTRHRLALTGTPLENNLAELWSQFNLLMPGFLGDSRRFAQLYRTPIEKHGDAARRAHLARRVKPFILRRTKDMVLRELPPKTEIEHAVQIEGAQRDLYETVRATMEKKVRDALAARGLAQSHIVVLDALLKLRQVCCDPRLLASPAARKVKDSAKLARLTELLPEMIAEGRRILLFSQFTSMLDLIEPVLRELAIAFVRLDGSTQDRKTPVARFQKGEVPLFLISLKAGGTGLNLTAADTVIHYDPWWNPAVENQATDRAHRLGQDKPVFVHRLIAAGTVEERIRALQSRKADLARGILDENAALAKALTAEDFQALFEPLAE